LIRIAYIRITEARDICTNNIYHRRGYFNQVGWEIWNCYLTRKIHNLLFLFLVHPGGERTARDANQSPPLGFAPQFCVPFLILIYCFSINPLVVWRLKSSLRPSISVFFLVFLCRFLWFCACWYCLWLLCF